MLLRQRLCTLPSSVWMFTVIYLSHDPRVYNLVGASGEQTAVSIQYNYGSTLDFEVVNGDKGLLLLGAPARLVQEDSNLSSKHVGVK